MNEVCSFWKGPRSRRIATKKPQLLKSQTAHIQEGLAQLLFCGLASGDLELWQVEQLSEECPRPAPPGRTTQGSGGEGCPDWAENFTVCLDVHQAAQPTDAAVCPIRTSAQTGSCQPEPFLVSLALGPRRFPPRLQVQQAPSACQGTSVPCLLGQPSHLKAHSSAGSFEAELSPTPPPA